MRGKWLRTGCAEKKISFCERIAPQTMAARIQMPPCATAAVPGLGVSREQWAVCLDTHLSTGSGTEAGHLSGSRRLFVRGEAPLRSGRAPQRRLVVSQLLTPLCVCPRFRTVVRISGSSSWCNRRPPLQEGSSGLELVIPRA